MKRWTLCLLLLSCKSTASGSATTPDGSTAPDAAGGSNQTSDTGGGPALTLAETYARAGAVVGSCMPDDGINRNTFRFWDPLPAPAFVSLFGKQAQCLATSGGGCAALRTCLGYEATIGGPPCTTACAGTKLTFCEQEGGRNVRLLLDCGKVGLSCDPMALCSDGPRVACSDGDSVLQACSDDGRGGICKRGTVMRTGRCADLGLTCQTGQCRGTGAACPDTTFPGSEGQTYLQGLGCEGNLLRACVGGKEQSFDCTAQGQGEGFGCQSKDGQFFCGLAAECVPSETAQGTVTCEGNTVVFCNAGRTQRVDCTALGFTGCDVDLSQGHFGCVPGLVPREIP